MIPGDHSVFVPLGAKNVDPASDVDLTILWIDQPYARALYNGNALPKNIVVTNTDGDTVTYANVASGCRVFGLFKTLQSTAHGTTATGIVAEK